MSTPDKIPMWQKERSSKGRTGSIMLCARRCVYTLEELVLIVVVILSLAASVPVSAFIVADPSYIYDRQPIKHRFSVSTRTTHDRLPRVTSKVSAKNSADKLTQNEHERSESEMAEDLLERRMVKDTVVAGRIENTDENVVENERWFEFTPSNFDESALPVPLFTAVLILLFSLYVTMYGFYVGMYGFPSPDGDASSLPRIF